MQPQKNLGQCILSLRRHVGNVRLVVAVLVAAQSVVVAVCTAAKMCGRKIMQQMATLLLETLSIPSSFKQLFLQGNLINLRRPQGLRKFRKPLLHRLLMFPHNFLYCKSR